MMICTRISAILTAQVMNKLELQKLRDRKWFIQSAVAPTGDGVSLDVEEILAGIL